MLINTDRREIKEPYLFFHPAQREDKVPIDKDKNNSIWDEGKLRLLSRYVNYLEKYMNIGKSWNIFISLYTMYVHVFLGVFFGVGGLKVTLTQ